MSRDLTPDFAAALADRTLRPAIFFEGVFATETVRLWSGLGEVGWAGESWAGAGMLLGLGSIEETGAVVATGTAVSLSGVPTALVQLVIDEARQGLPGRVWIGLLSEDGTIVADPVQAFSGRLDVPEITDDVGTCTITIGYESRLIDLNTPRTWRYTHESQQALYPGDRGFEYVTAIQDREITLGAGMTNPLTVRRSARIAKNGGLQHGPGTVLRQNLRGFTSQWKPTVPSSPLT